MCFEKWQVFAEKHTKIDPQGHKKIDRRAPTDQKFRACTIWRGPLTPLLHVFFCVFLDLETTSAKPSISQRNHIWGDSHAI